MKTKILGTLAIVLGVFLCVGVASAADADLLQPASDITYNENVDINGSLNVDSLRVGTAGLGGVTFFNGTVLNEGTNPFTVGDDMRVDGEIYRIQKGDDPIKISDNVVPTLTNTNDFGSSSNRWNNIYAKDGDYSGDISVSGDVDGVDISEENAVWYSTQAYTSLSIPSDNPKESKILTGLAWMPLCNDPDDTIGGLHGQTGKIINLPSNFYTNSSTYSVVATSPFQVGAETATFSRISILNRDDNFSIFATCDGNDGASVTESKIPWIAVGY